MPNLSRYQTDQSIGESEVYESLKYHFLFYMEATKLSSLPSRN